MLTTPLHARKLGRLPYRFDPSAVYLRDYMTVKFPPTPPSLDRARKMPADWGMMLNDKIGDCTIAAVGHMVMLWTYFGKGSAQVISDADVEAAYIAVTGEEGAAFDPKTGANDNGCMISDVLEYAKKVGIGGHKILGHVTLQPNVVTEQKFAANAFGATDLGISLPLTAQRQNDVWDYVPGSPDNAPNSWGGHSVPLFDYDKDFLYVLTWGQVMPMTYRFLFHYCDEAHAAVSLDWLDSAGLSPTGLNQTKLLSDLSLLS